MRYGINNTSVIYDIIDNDIVIIHLENGNYYNLSDSGAVIWKQITKNISRDHLLAILHARYHVDKAVLEKDLNTFLQQLEAEGLVVRQPPEEATSSKDNPPKAESKKLDYSPPVLDVFTDMQDFLLVDPIHEVDEHGRPKYTPPQTNDE
jgi:hypothetical protein